jgi:hypothetical protein
LHQGVDLVTPIFSATPGSEAGVSVLAITELYEGSGWNYRPKPLGLRVGRETHRAEHQRDES